MYMYKPALYRNNENHQSIILSRNTTFIQIEAAFRKVAAAQTIAAFGAQRKK